MNKIAIFSLGVVVGATASYFITRKVIGDKYEKDIEDIRNLYTADKKTDVGSRTVRKQNEEKTESVPKSAQKIEVPQDYADYIKNNIATKYSSRTVEVPDEAEAEHPRDIDLLDMYNISVETYTNDDRNYEHVEYTYYEGDDILTDQNDEPIAVSDYLPSDFRAHIDEEELDTAYFRNEKRGLDIQLTRLHGNYGIPYDGYSED